MAIPLVYNLRSVRGRWTSSVVAVLGIAGTVGVFVAMLALARGFKATLVSSGPPQNAIVQQAGADSEMTSAITLEEVRIVEDAAAGRAQGDDGAGERRSRGDRGAAAARHGQRRQRADPRRLAARARRCATTCAIVEGRFLTPGLSELVVGPNAAKPTRARPGQRRSASGRAPGRSSGIFDAGGSAFDSEVWADADVAQRHLPPPGRRVPVGHRAAAIRGCVSGVRKGRQGRPAPGGAGLARAGVLRQPVAAGDDAHHRARRHGRRRDGRSAPSSARSTRCTRPWPSARARSPCCARWASAAAASSCRSSSSRCGSRCSAASLGCLVVLPVNGLTTGTINWQTFSHLSFAFRITPDLLLLGIGFALLMGVVGGVPPAIRAARGQRRPDDSRDVGSLQAQPPCAWREGFSACTLVRPDLQPAGLRT